MAGPLYQAISGNPSAAVPQSSAPAAPPSGGSAAGSIPTHVPDETDLLAQKYGWGPAEIAHMRYLKSNHGSRTPVANALTQPVAPYQNYADTAVNKGIK